VARSPIDTPMRIRLQDDRRERLRSDVQAFLLREFDHELSDYQTNRLIDFFVRQLGAPVYNQAIQDARSYLQTRLEDLEGEFHEPEPDRL
jgi:uncharacterized protein (DUF2164 family)